MLDAIEGEGGVRTRRVFVSARNGHGLTLLRQVIADAVATTLLDDLKSAPSAAPCEFGQAEVPLTDNAVQALLQSHE
jgi:hypothetical protein